MLEEVIMNLQLTLTNVQSFAMETSLAMLKLQNQSRPTTPPPIVPVPVSTVPVSTVPVSTVPVSTVPVSTVPVKLPTFSKPVDESDNIQLVIS
jgi:hypothetical protein